MAFSEHDVLTKKQSCLAMMPVMRFVLTLIRYFVFSSDHRDNYIITVMLMLGKRRIRTF